MRFNNHYNKRLKKMKRGKQAVSETVGTLLLLSISVSLFTVLYTSVLTTSPSPIKPAANIICKIEKDIKTSITDIIVLEHRGGESLDLDTEVTVSINGTTNRFIVKDYLNNKSKENGEWNVGEKVTYPSGNLTNIEVAISVIEIHSNSLIMSVVFQR